MSQWLSAYIISWDKFQKEWMSYSKDKNSYDDFWDDEDYNIGDLLLQCGEEYKWQSGNSNDYNFVFHSFLTVDFSPVPMPENYSRFCKKISKFLCEGSPAIIDVPDDKLRWLDVIYSLYSPETVMDICNDWDNFDWLSVKEQYDTARKGDFDYSVSKEIVEDWIILFRTAKKKSYGVVTLLS